MVVHLKLENYLMQNETLKLGTTMESLEKRLNLLDLVDDCHAEKAGDENENEVHLCIFKCVLIKLGFLFVYGNNDDPNKDSVLVKFPTLNLFKKLEIVYKILKIFQSKYYHFSRKEIKIINQLIFCL
jgi:hypothetical protein